MLAPGSTIGILGGGQLGRMLCFAAARLGFQTRTFSPDTDGPASQVSGTHHSAAYDDKDALKAFADACDIVTLEFENIPVETVDFITKSGTTVFPRRNALETAQDRLTEKSFIRDNGVPVTPFREVSSLEQLEAAIEALGLPLVLKTRRMGYDGLGQKVIRDRADAKAAFEVLGDTPKIAEGFINFTREVSVVAGRREDGESASFPLIENDHRNHILSHSTLPAPRDNALARDYAKTVLEALDYVGVMAVEFFEKGDGSLLVNEIAPRVHNSGHGTMNAGCVDQFELHIRAIAGWPLGDLEPKNAVIMENLIGDDVKALANLAKEPATHIHMYGKKDIRPGRKMAHVNRVKPL